MDTGTDKVRIELQLTPDEYDYIKRRANNEGLHIATYLRYAVMIEGIIAADGNAWGTLGKRLLGRYLTKATTLMNALMHAKQKQERVDIVAEYRKS